MSIELWAVFAIISLIAVIIEIFVPTLFCINFAFAGIITALLSILFDWMSVPQLIIVFLALSLLSILFVKPLLVKILNKENNTDFDGQYIGRVVQTIEPVTKNSGAVTVFDERWEARLTENAAEEIPSGANVKIVANDSTILFVEKI